MWPFQKKREPMTVDVVAKIIASEIKINMEPYTRALDRFAVTHDNDEELKKLLGEIWILHIAILDYTFSVINFSESLRDKIIPMIVVGYAKIDHNHYISRSHFYGERINNSPPEAVTIVMGTAFAELLDKEYYGYKVANGKKMLIGTIGALAIQTIKTLSELTFKLQKKYEIVP